MKYKALAIGILLFATGALTSNPALLTQGVSSIAAAVQETGNDSD